MRTVPPLRGCESREQSIPRAYAHGSNKFRRCAARLFLPLDRGLTPTAQTNSAAARLDYFSHLTAGLRPRLKQIPPLRGWIILPLVVGLTPTAQTNSATARLDYFPTSRRAHARGSNKFRRCAAGLFSHLSSGSRGRGSNKFRRCAAGLFSSTCRAGSLRAAQNKFRHCAARYYFPPTLTAGLRLTAHTNLRLGSSAACDLFSHLSSGLRPRLKKNSACSRGWLLFSSTSSRRGSRARLANKFRHCAARYFFTSHFYRGLTPTAHTISAAARLNNADPSGLSPFPTASEG